MSQVAVATNVLVVPNQLPVKSVKELIEYAKKHPGELELCVERQRHHRAS